MSTLFSHLRYSDPALWEFIKLWPVTIFLPAVLLLVASLALVTHLWDQHERAPVAHGADETDED